MSWVLHVVQAMSRTPAKPDNGVHIVLQRMRTFASMNPFKQEVSNSHN
jgi:hypothetical protein